MMTLYDDQMALHGRAQAAAAMNDGFMKDGSTGGGFTGGDLVVPAPWDDVPAALRATGAATDDVDSADDAEMMAALLSLCRIGGEGAVRPLTPDPAQRELSLIHI